MSCHAMNPLSFAEWATYIKWLEGWVGHVALSVVLAKRGSFVDWELNWGFFFIFWRSTAVIVRFETPSAVLANVQILRNVTPCHFFNSYQLFDSEDENTKILRNVGFEGYWIPSRREDSKFTAILHLGQKVKQYLYRPEQVLRVPGV